MSYPYYYDYYDDSDPALSGDHAYSGNLSGGYYGLGNGNFSNKDFYFFEDERGPVRVETPVSYVQPTILVCICLAGLVGNALVIFVTVRQVSMRKVTHFYLSSLAVVNVLYLLAIVPLTAVAYAIHHWPFGAAICE